MGNLKKKSFFLQRQELNSAIVQIAECLHSMTSEDYERVLRVILLSFELGHEGQILLLRDEISRLTTEQPQEEL